MKKAIRIVSEESPCTNCFYKEIIPCCCCMEFVAWKRKLLRMKGADFEHYENRDDWTTPITNVLAVIDDAPSIDIIRCRECKYWVSDGGALMLCDIHKDPTVPEHFCSYGERDSEKPNNSEIPTGSERVGKYPYNCNWDE